MANGLLITDYLWYGSGAPSGAPSLASGSQYAIYQDIVAGAMYYWDLDTTAWVQIPELDGSGHIPLAELTGITTSQLSATAGIVAGQIASVNPSALTGSGTVPVGGLPVGSVSQKGIVEVDGITITAASGVISAVGGGGGSLTYHTAALASDVPLVGDNSWQSAVSLSLGPGTWLVGSTAILFTTSTTDAAVQITDGTTVYAQGVASNLQSYASATVALSTIIVLTGTTTLTLQCSADSGDASILSDIANAYVPWSGPGLATSIFAIEIG